MMTWKVLGHEWAVDLLRSHIAQQKLHHAYLLSGPDGVGRRTLALRLAQAINCAQPPEPGTPCLTCRVCRQIEAMQQADLLVVQAGSKGGVLKVDQVRELQRSLALHPYESAYKVALLLRFEEAHVSAMNALLKMLEEPPARAILLLTADSRESLLPTVVSRCETLRLHPLPIEKLAAGLRAELGVEEQQARLLAHLSGGRPGLALRLSRDPELMKKRVAGLDELKRLLGCGLVERFQFAERTAKDSKDKEKFRDLLEVWLSFWRDVTLRAAGTQAPIANLDWQAPIDQAASALGLARAREMTQLIERSAGLLERNVNPRLIAETLMLDLPYISLELVPA
ncbi:MAG: DNA polymerase III subunit [Anaerolineae bacterium]|nr:DNA polymerase III subunit [Anaerolineae bacterium]